MGTKYTAATCWRPLAAVTLLMPLMAFCSSGTVEPPTATANVQAMSGPATIYINEVLAHTDEPQVDAVELYNPNAYAVDLTGWCLNDDQDEKDRFCIPEREPRAIISGNGYLFYTANDFVFRLSEFGEDVYLYAPVPNGLQEVDHVKFGVSPNGVSMGRYRNSTGAVDFPLLSKVTLGEPNAGPLVPEAVISELMYEPEQGPEYLVITNSSDQEFPLYDPAHRENRWQVAGIGDNNDAYVLPAQIVLEPGESIVLSADPVQFAATYPSRNLRVFGPFPGKLKNEGERVVLQEPQPPEINGDVAYADVDVVEYGVTAPWPAAAGTNRPISRVDLRGYGNDPINWRLGPSDRLLMLPLVARQQ